MNDLTQQPATSSQQPATRFQCRHIFADGHRCGSICLRNEPFCYYHHTARKPAPRKTFGSHASFDLPLPEDRSAIQASIGIILQRIASNDLDPKRAGLLLYGLQIASLNLPKQQQRDRDKDEEDIVEEVTNHPELGTIAPQTEIVEQKSSAALILEELREQFRPKTAVLPQIQATEDLTSHLITSTSHPANLRHVGRFARVGDAAIAARMESRRCPGFRLKKMPSPRNRSLTHVPSSLKKHGCASSAT